MRSFVWIEIESYSWDLIVKFSEDWAAFAIKKSLPILNILIFPDNAVNTLKILNTKTCKQILT